jgi:hypothetical protein
MRIEFAFGFVKVGNGFAFPRVGERHWFGGEANQKSDDTWDKDLRRSEPIQIRPGMKEEKRQSNQTRNEESGEAEQTRQTSDKREKRDQTWITAVSVILSWAARFSGSSNA